MNRFVLLLAGTGLAFSLMSPATHAADNEDAAAVLGALVIIGAAALAHHEDHHRNGRHLTQQDEIAAFDRGFRDGLHDAPYDHGHDSNPYNDGFAAGLKERHNRLAHRHPREGDGPNAPTLAMRSCVGEASAKWGRNPRDIQVVKSRQAAGDDFYVEVAAGHRHGNCEVSAEGQIYLFKNGRI